MDEILAARTAVEGTATCVVLRHRDAGVLTWALLRQIEREVLTEVAAAGQHGAQVLAMLRAPAEMGYPSDDRPVSFQGHEFVPIAFNAIVEAWNRGH
ncbi:MAG: DUF2471 family protein [Pseudomonadota bacterium]